MITPIVSISPTSTLRCHRNQSKTTGSQCGGGENGKPSATVGSHDYNYDDSGNFDEDAIDVYDCFQIDDGGFIMTT